MIPIPGVRAIQIGLGGEAVRRYVNEWIVRIQDVTETAHQLGRDLELGTTPRQLPPELEVPYPLSPELRASLASLSGSQIIDSIGLSGTL